MVRKLLAVVAGLVAGTVMIAVVEAVSSRMYPLPAGLDPNDAAALRAHIARLPMGAFLMVLLAYASGSLAAGLVATWVAGRRSATQALVAGVLLTVAGVANLVAVPHPLWFAVVSTGVYVPLAWLGARMVRAGTARPAAEGVLGPGTSSQPLRGPEAS